VRGSAGRPRVRRAKAGLDTTRLTQHLPRLVVRAPQCCKGLPHDLGQGDSIMPSIHPLLLAILCGAGIILTACGTSTGQTGQMSVQIGAACDPATATPVCGQVAGLTSAANCDKTTKVWTALACPAGSLCTVQGGVALCTSLAGIDALSGLDTAGTDAASPTDAAPAKACTKPGDCHDNNPCTTDTCDAKTSACVFLPVLGCGGGAVPCVQPVDCAAGTTCDTVRHVCAQCVVHGDCKGGQRCADNKCTVSAACQSDAECKEVAGVCDKKFGVCVPCLADSDCAAEQRCVENACVDAKVCKSSKDCPKVCATGAGKCVDCTVDSDCKTGSWCSEDGLCKPVACSSNVCSDAGAFECLANGSGYFVTPGGCSDASACTLDSCEAGFCKHAPMNDGDPCDDGNACTSADVCQGAVCAGVKGGCDDKNPCTTDTCSSKACVYGGMDCPAGSTCGITDAGYLCVVQAAQCGGSAPPCANGKPCSSGYCAESCEFGAKSCPGGLVCLFDRCVTAVPPKLAAAPTCSHQFAAAGTNCSAVAKCDSQGKCSVCIDPTMTGADCQQPIPQKWGTCTDPKSTCFPNCQYKVCAKENAAVNGNSTKVNAPHNCTAGCEQSPPKLPVQSGTSVVQIGGESDSDFCRRICAAQAGGLAAMQSNALNYCVWGKCGDCNAITAIPSETCKLMCGSASKCGVASAACMADSGCANAVGCEMFCGATSAGCSAGCYAGLAPASMALRDAYIDCVNGAGNVCVAP